MSLKKISELSVNDIITYFGVLKMICYEDELVVKVWLHGCGHASGLIRTLDTGYLRENSANINTLSTYISWWPGRVDYNKHSTPVRNFQKRTAGPKKSYFQDKFAETGPRTQALFQADEQNFIPHGNQAITMNQDEAGNPILEIVVSTKPANIVNIPGIGTKAYYAHQKHGFFREKDVGPRDLEIESKITRREKLAQGQVAIWGVNLVEMAYWWQNFLANPKNGYQYASTDSNCAGVMMGALIAGGASAFVTIKSAYLYRTPKEVRDVILALEIKLDTLNIQSLAFKDNYERGGAISIISQMKALTSDLYTVAQFKTASSSPKFGFRREQVRKMDDNLSTYRDCGEWTRDNYIKKLTSLVNIMENVISHLRDKPNSDRRSGVEKLGAQVINLLTKEDSTLNIYLRDYGLAKENIGERCDTANGIRDMMFSWDTQDTTRMKAKNR